MYKQFFKTHNKSSFTVEKLLNHLCYIRNNNNNNNNEKQNHIKNEKSIKEFIFIFLQKNFVEKEY